MDNTMTRRKKGQATIYKTIHKKLNIEQHETHKQIIEFIKFNSSSTCEIYIYRSKK